MNNNLVPTARTDRNGRTVIRHMRPATDASMARQVLPVASLPTADDSFREARQELYKFLDNNSQNGYPDTSSIKTVDSWLHESTDEQLSELLAAIHTVRLSKYSSDPALLREAAVIRAIVHQTFKYPAKMIHTHDMLSFRSAFSESRFDLTKASLGIIMGVYLGNRCDMPTKPLPESQLPSREGFSAVLRYSFEMMSACLFHGQARQALPVTEIFVEEGSSGRPSERPVYPIFPYKDQALASMISEKPEQVEKLIDLSLGNNTSDPNRLRALLRYDGPSSLSSGAL